MPPWNRPGFAIWQVWWYDQDESIKTTDPSQPTDHSKEKRMYVIIAPPKDNWNKITCCPVQNAQERISITEVELVNGIYGFVRKHSKILCQEIYTLPKKFFLNCEGSIGQAHSSKVKYALKEHLRLN